ncbi:amino acid permease [Arthrobacter sp. HMWF013]|nr:amino acid permease [Arthrobacter sp. HMWF013]
MTTVTSSQQHQLPTQGTLRRSITFRDLVVYGLLFITPTGIAGIFGTLYASSNGALALVYIIAAAAVSLTAISYAQMSRAVPTAGSVFAYANAGIGPRSGFIGGWMMLLDYVFIPSIAYLFAGLALHSAVPSVPAWLFTAVAVILTTLCNLQGVKFAAWVGRVVLYIEFALLGLVMIFGVVVLINRGPAQSLIMPLAGDGQLTLVVLAAAASIAVFSFLGFDGIASFAEENSGDPRLVGKATITCLILAGLLLVAVSYVMALLAPFSPAEVAANPDLQGTAFYDTIRTSVAPWLATVFAIVKALGSAFCAMVGQAAASRLLFAMAREHTLPPFLAKVGRRSGTPIVSVAILGGLSLVIAVTASLQGDGLEILSTTINVGALVGFVLVNIAVIGYFAVQRKSGRLITHILVPALGALIAVVLLVSTGETAKIVGGAWLLIGLIILLVRKALNKPVPHLAETAAQGTDKESV